VHVFVPLSCRGCGGIKFGTVVTEMNGGLMVSKGPIHENALKVIRGSDTLRSFHAEITIRKEGGTVSSGLKLPRRFSTHDMV